MVTESQEETGQGNGNNGSGEESFWAPWGGAQAFLESLGQGQGSEEMADTTADTGSGAMETPTEEDKS